jgi:class 3 adenylate cyclase/tetratricopeptide (TPR) repeat protein
MGRAAADGRDLGAYLSARHAAWLDQSAAPAWVAADGTFVFADVSGFTPLTERLARLGKVGAEHLTEILNAVFGDLLAIAGARGGDCLKFGGDAILLSFGGDDHAARATAAATEMLVALKPYRRLETEAGIARLGMSVGVASGECHLFLAGAAHHELLVTGPVATATLAMEAAASSGQVVVDRTTAALLDGATFGASIGEGLVVRRPPPVGGLDSLHATAPAIGGHERGLPQHLAAHLRTSDDEGEHRLAAVGFVQIGGTDARLADDGPAALADALHEVISCTQDACVEHGTTFLATDVDKGAIKLIIAAGVPAAGPDDADCLVHTVRRIVGAGGPLPVRAGASRGRVFAVDLGSRERRCFTVIGDAVNLAARVMGRADWGEVLATDELVDRVRTSFVRTPLEPFAVKGKSQPVHASAIGDVHDSFDGLEPDEGDVPLVGRDRELAIVRAALADAHEGRGVVVELVGEPGIGKSKLLGAVLSLPHGLPVFSMEAGRYSLATPYYPLRRPLRQAIGVGVDHGKDDVEAALRRTVADVAPDLLPWLPLLGVPLGLEIADTPEMARLDPAFRPARVQNAVARLLTGVLSGPVLITVEDAHWLDAATSDLLHELLNDVARRPWAIIVTRRPTVGGLSLPDSANPTRIALDPLGDAAASALASSLTADTDGVHLQPKVLADLAARSGGNPLFLQELVRAAADGSVTELPDTVEAVIAATIDTLPGDERSLLRRAAVLGSRFPAPVLAQMLDVTPAAMAPRLRRLGHFLGPDTTAAGGTQGMVRFRHVLLRDVAYEGLPFKARHTLHGRAGEILEAEAGDRPEEVAELLSIHFHAARRYTKAWQYSCLAGERSQQAGAPVEATAFYGRALEAARHLPEITSPDRAAVAERLGDAAELSGRYVEAMAAYRQARRFVAGDPHAVAALFRKAGIVWEREGRFSDALRSYKRGFAALDRTADLTTEVMDAESLRLRAELTVSQGAAQLRQGRHLKARPILEEGVRLAEAARPAEVRAVLAHAYRLLDWIHIELRLEPEVPYSELSLAIYDELGDEVGRTNALNNMGIAAYYEGRWDDAASWYRDSLEAARAAGALAMEALILNNIAEISSDQGYTPEADTLFHEALAIWRASGHAMTGMALGNLGRVAAREGRFEDAAAWYAQARGVLRRIGGEAMLLEADARDAERFVLAGYPEAAIELANDVDARAKRMNASPYVSMLVERVLGYAYAQAGDPLTGWSRLGYSLVRSREAAADYESALTLQALGAVGHLLGLDRAGEFADEATAIFERLGVVRTPTVPLPDPTTTERLAIVR